MADYLTEQEQVEILKRWIKQYSGVVLIGIVIALITVTGWRLWQARQIKILTHASHAFDEMLNLRAQNDMAGSLIQAHKLENRYSNTSFASFAALMLARDAIVKMNYAEAEKQLEWAMSHSKIDAIQEIARLRLARVYLAQHKAKDALDILQKSNVKAFTGFNQELQGDAYRQLKDNDKARTAYQTALRALPNAEAARPLLQMKIDHLTPLTSAT